MTALMHSSLAYEMSSSPSYSIRRTYRMNKIKSCSTCSLGHNFHYLSQQVSEPRRDGIAASKSHYTPYQFLNYQQWLKFVCIFVEFPEAGERHFCIWAIVSPRMFERRNGIRRRVTTHGGGGRRPAAGVHLVSGIPPTPTEKFISSLSFRLMNTFQPSVVFPKYLFNNCVPTKRIKFK